MINDNTADSIKLAYIEAKIYQGLIMECERSKRDGTFTRAHARVLIEAQELLEEFRQIPEVAQQLIADEARGTIND